MTPVTPVTPVTQVVRSLLPISLMTDVLIYEGLPPDAVEAARVLVRALRDVKPLAHRAPRTGPGSVQEHFEAIADGRVKTGALKETGFSRATTTHTASGSGSGGSRSASASEGAPPASSSSSSSRDGRLLLLPPPTTRASPPPRPVRRRATASSVRRQ